MLYPKLCYNELCYKEVVAYLVHFSIKHIVDTHQKCLGEAIMKTCLYNFDLLKPPFYIVKLGFTGVYIIVLISA